MLPIFICEDNTVQRKAIEDYIQNYIMIEDIDMKVEISTDNPYEIISYLKENSFNNGIYFLDIDLQSDIDGLKLGAIIRNMDISGKIVFITTHSEMMYFTFKYKVEAMDYIIKDDINDLQKRIIDVLEQARKHYQDDKNDQEERIKIKINNKIRVFSLKEVMFIETSQVPHKLILHLSQNTIEFYGKINEIEALSSSMIRIHKSFVINLENISVINKRKYEVIMKNGESCPIAIRKVSMLNKRLR
ncbi:LytTR family DNA-binding domain-containing protein [Enterococcus gilvus]|uniref:LytR/AlgR family response regulator transcription factor n=1 Tax=Enterococcus gilvus TaxID=160453 RepID=UPI001C8CB39C|nr:LytTR family DNA-binding domain-containing protein [Enterococcus gilvus]MBX8937148.1 response regulator transcription factor [Enterococcus gilvus]